MPLPRSLRPHSNHIALAAAWILVPVIGVAACSQPVYLPPGVGADDDGSADGNFGDGASDDDGGYPVDPDGDPTQPAGCDDPGTCEYDLDTTCAGSPLADPSGFPACPGDICASGGHCVPSAAISGEQLDMLDLCDSTSACVPDSFIEHGGLFTARTCTSAIGGGEGRCLSSCLPDVARKAGLLTPDGCAASELCVPCFDPFTGSATGACDISCDAGPAQAATTLPKCCQDKGGGTCVPSSMLDPEQADRLDDEECAQLGMAGGVCVPQPILAAHLVDVPFNPVECVTGDFIQALGLDPEGGCLPECIPIVDDLPVTQENCSAGYKCVPCTVGGQDTGACEPQ